EKRLQYILEDAGIQILVTESHLTKWVSSDVERICLDKNSQEIKNEPITTPVHGVTPENLAYVIYTSGSTGKPKGVMIRHISTFQFIKWVHSTFSYEELSGVLASTSLSFDLSVFELFSPLTGGGKVILVRNALEITGIKGRYEVTLINTVPSVARELIKDKNFPPSVLVINLAGERLHSLLVKDFYRYSSVKKVYNLYGPSEDTTYSTYKHIKYQEENISIGKPIFNTQLYVLDKYGQPVPVGVIGELYIGGNGLARGYLNQPELTAERFIPHPFNDEPGARLYRTGDLVRYLPDGDLEFVGRADDQVKIRGFRIELGEVEATLNALPSIQEAVVIVREDEPGDKRLVAYVVGEETPAEWRIALKEKLPAYMVPAHFVKMEVLPLTPNGKVDRKVLPHPGQVEKEGEYVAPQNEREELLASIWE
ncbi:amino acid adenylation domain-containing protein, partial [Bacillus pumilus]